MSFNEIKFPSAQTPQGKNANRVKKKVGDFMMTLDLHSEGISNVLYHVGHREKAFMSILYNEINEGDVCIDLGANIGYTTLYMCDRVGESGKVYAIEPDPWNVSLLIENINQNNFTKRTELCPIAISDKKAEIEFWQSNKSNLSSVQKTKHSTSCININCESLNTFLEDRKHPNFIKMDIEGHEVKVFEGGLDYFDKNTGPTKFLLEVHPHFYNDDNDFEKILTEYFKLGFKSKYVVATPIPRPRKFVDAGYELLFEVPTDGFVRGIYGHISNEHLLEFACRENIEGTSKKIVRSFLIERE